MEWIKEHFTKLGPKPKGWYSAKDIQEISGNSRSVVWEKINEMMKSGELEMMECLENGHRVKVYKKKDYANNKNRGVKRI